MAKVDSNFSSKGVFNRMRVDIEGVSNKILRESLDKFGKQCVAYAQAEMVRKKRVATGKLISSIKYEINKLGDSRKYKTKGFMFIFSGNAEGTGGVDSHSGKMFRYGNTYEHGLKNKMFAPLTIEIEEWMRAKGMSPTGHKRVPKESRKYKSKRKWKGRRSYETKDGLYTMAESARAIATQIARDGFKSLDDDGDNTLQDAVDMYKEQLREELTRQFNKSIKGFISKGLGFERKV